MPILQTDDADSLPKPGAYLAVFAPVDAWLPDIKATARLPRRYAFTLAHTRGLVAFADDVHLATADEGRLVLILSGQMFRPQSSAPAEAVLLAYRQHGLDFARHLSGNFTLIIVDQEAERVLIATDRINSAKLLYSRQGEALVVSNDSDLHPQTGLRPDEKAIAFFLASGFLPNDRTLFEEVRLLYGGTVASIEGHTLRPQRYWRLEKPHPLHTASVAQLKQEFAHLLVEAVRRRLPPGAPAYISLSAGGDSRAILGILKEQLRVDDVRCFSYALGRLQPDSDEVLAQQMAALYGYEHRMLDSFDGDVVGAIKNNARWGSGLTGVCDEMATWQTLHKEVAEASGPRPILFTGETANARADYHLSSVEDVIAAAKLKDFSVLPWLEPILGAESFAAMDARAKEAIAENVARCPPTDTLIGMRQVLWLQQRDRLYLPWREYFAGRFSTVGLPMLDDDVLDFVLRLPDELHRGRRLYDVVVKEMMPALFAIPSARSSSYARYWPEALREQAPQIRAFVESFDSPFDDVVAPDVLLRALELNSAWRQHSQSLLTKVLKKGYRLLKRTWLRESGLMTASQLKRPVEPHVFLKRALLLRTYLANASQQAPLVTPAVQER